MSDTQRILSSEDIAVLVGQVNECRDKIKVIMSQIRVWIDEVEALELKRADTIKKLAHDLAKKEDMVQTQLNQLSVAIQNTKNTGTNEE